MMRDAIGCGRRFLHDAASLPDRPFVATWISAKVPALLPSRSSTERLDQFTPVCTITLSVLWPRNADAPSEREFRTASV